MRKSAISLAMLAAVLVTVSCQKDEVPEFKETAYVTDILPGVFSVRDGDDKPITRICFSSGNLYYDISGGTKKWGFFDNQYECGPSAYSQGHDTRISLFTWGYGNWSTVPDTDTTENYNEKFVDWGKAYGNDWRTLTINEWDYLLNKRSMSNGGSRYSSNVTYGGMMGIAIYPDDYSGSYLASGVNYDSTSFPEGVVFLPAAGYRYKGEVSEVGTAGYYWSKTKNVGTTSRFAFRVAFNSDGVNSLKADSSAKGRSVRLVIEAK